MASFLLSRTTAAVGIGLGLSFSIHPLSPFRSTPLQCQYTAPYYRTDSPDGAETGWAIDPNDPLLRKQGNTRRNNHSTARTMRQVSLGSVLGLLAGMGLRAFSRVLAVLLGIAIVAVEVCIFLIWVAISLGRLITDCWQFAASKGYNLLPFNRMQKYAKDVDVRKTVTENMPFKISFAATMALGAFAHL